VIEEAGLVLMPFSFYDRTRGRYVDSLQIVGLGESELTEHGKIEHRGLVRRAGVEAGRLWVLSDLAFQSVDITNRDAPLSLASIDFVRDQELLDAGLSACADSARMRGTRVGGEMFIGDDFFFEPYFPFPLLGLFSGLCFPVALTGLTLALGGLWRTRPGRYNGRDGVS
jgi:hypothetical protein